MIRPLLALDRLSFLASEGKVRKASFAAFPLRIVEIEMRRVPSKGWAYPRCGGAMRVVALLTEHAVVDRIIDHLKLAFVTERPQPPQAVVQDLVMDADPPLDYIL